jgi:hypothetical protein
VHNDARRRRTRWPRPAGLAYKRVLGLECEVGTVLGVSTDDEGAREPELA